MIETIDIDELLLIARNAGKAIMEVYNTPFEFSSKIDGSPLTIADKNSNEIINHYLNSKYTLPVLSEENEEVSYDIRKNWKYYWLIDPLDGTKEFINKRREFTVNIALIEDGKPILGVVYAPVFDDMFYAIKGKGAYFIKNNEQIKLNSKPTVNIENQMLLSSTGLIRLMISFSHSDNFELSTYISNSENTTIQIIKMGSSLKFCRLAQSNVDAYIRTLPTMEWDTAAAQVIVEESGRKLVGIDSGEPLVYNKESLVNQGFIST